MVHLAMIHIAMTHVAVVHTVVVHLAMIGLNVRHQVLAVLCFGELETDGQIRREL